MKLARRQLPVLLTTSGVKVMEVQGIQAVKAKGGKRRPDALKLLLIAGLSVQAWGVVMGLGLIILNLTH